MDFDFNSFTTRLRELLYDNFPYEEQLIHGKKHRGIPHFRDIAFFNNKTIHLPNGNIYFELGNEESERLTPQYHILEDAQVIKKKNKGTNSTKGSQRFIDDKGKRDYGIAQFKYSGGKQKEKPYYEYRKNVRGKRSLVLKSTRRVITTGQGGITTINRNSKYYENIHYHYLEKTLDNNLPLLASEFGCKLGRTKIDYKYEQLESYEQSLSWETT